MGIAFFLNIITSQSTHPILKAIQGLPTLKLAFTCVNLTLFIMFLFISYARQIFVCVGRIRILKDDSAVANSTPIRMSSVGGDVRDVIIEAVNGKDVAWSVICLLVVQANFTTTPTLAFLCFVAIRGVTSIQVYRNSERQEPLLLEEEAGCLKEAACNAIFALITMVYQKGLKLSSLAKQSYISREVVNYMAVDVQRIGDYSWYLHDIWMLPLQIIFALAILYKNVGIASVATLIATIISIMITIPVAKIQEDYQGKLMAGKDERMRKTSECLKNMRILKLQAWEDKCRVKLKDMQCVEFRWLRKAFYSQASITFLFWSSPIFVLAVTFGTSILLGGQLTAGGVLSTLATFRILQEPLRNFPDLVCSDALGKTLSTMLANVIKDLDSKAQDTLNSQGKLNSAIDHLTRAKISVVRKRVSSLNSVLKSIQKHVDNIDQQLSVTML
ncbi:hypothetical protein POTOM_060407 [Populus tomentosa]|uniref:ABC transmembrane type-1 domain-containing protein n=1 Tax=Populus tomentosa TaxID=118781 RepID=A0A8X7Y018_POPTO|nr:hypothetical protein POTOM_060407 [Populus tomentosa]